MTSTATGPTQLDPRYDPSEVERKWYALWEERGLFKPDMQSDGPAFIITIPPPNVTGELHMGHALTYGLEDILARYKRMNGFNTLVLPGTDHAGIATQNVVEKQLATEGLTRYDLGREKFLERVWAWKEQYAASIREQFMTLGCSFDWSRERFTMDSAYVDAVLEFFIRLYSEGSIYRGWRVINWCIRCHSAISDIEVEDVEREDALYYLRYPLSDGSGEIQVATVRPETIVGDVAVAVHPDDERYRELIGKTALLPLLNRELTIVGDPMVDTKFGTGAVKITPSHDFNDFEVAQRHHLAMPIAINQDARMTDVAGPYEGQSVEEARASILRDLEAGGYLVKREAYIHNVPTCDRCGTVLEPLLSEQWFMEMKELAGPAIDVVNDGRVQFVPSRWSKVYLDWMEKIRPWTLSRQLWWGHRIPIYYCANGHTVAAKSWPSACPECNAEIERQDPDVLDTWFSSALWPFAVLGWPEQTEDLEKFYPTSFMNTSSQILYLWIARMIMTGIKFKGDVPFPVVLINPTILNKHGQRMSKSLGTGIDPLELVRLHGADALRFGLITSGSTHSQEIRFSSERVELTRNFANKVWNAARLVLRDQAGEPDTAKIQLDIADLWILSRLNTVIDEVTGGFEAYEFSGAGQRLHDFIWAEFADWYLEIAKLRLYDEEDAIGRHTALAVMWSVLERVVRLLHPYMPFLTEEIWQHLRAVGSREARELSGWGSDLPQSVMTAPWPRAGERDRVAETSMEQVMNVVKSVRTTRSEYGVPPSHWIPAHIATASNTSGLLDGASIVEALARLRPLVIGYDAPADSTGSATILIGDATVYIPLDKLTNVEAERARLTKELQGTQSALAAVHAKLSNDKFLSRAPAHVVESEKDRAATFEERISRLKERLDILPS